MKQHDIAISISGTVNQQISLYNESISTETLVEEMQQGTILTSVGHGENNGRVYSIANGEFKQIGIVKSQETCDDMEFLEFSVSDDSDA